MLFYTFLFLSCTIFLVLVSGKDADVPIPSTLLEASGNADFAGIVSALDAGASIDVQNVNGWSAATFCVHNGDIKGLQHLISRGINLNTQDNDGITPLMKAAKQNDKEMVEALLAGNAGPHIASHNNQTAYDLAVDAGRKVVALIIAESAVLHAVEMQNHELQMQYLKLGAFIDIRTRSGYTPLISAASTGNSQAVKDLLEMGAYPNYFENDGWAALHFAAIGGYTSMAEDLLQAGADASAVTNDGRTPGFVAKTAGFESLATTLNNAKNKNTK